MKKISNWLVGSFFRTIGRFFAIAGIGILIYLLASKIGIKITDLFGIGRVYADENFSYSNSLWSYTYSNVTTDCNSSLRNCTINNYVNNMSLNTTANVDYVNTFRLYAYASDTNKFKSSNYYTFKYEVCQAEKDFTEIKSKGRGFAWQYNTTNAATGSTAGDPTQFSYRIDDKVSDNNCYYLSFSVKPPVDSRYIGFFFSYSGYGDSTSAVIPDATYFNYTGGTINVKSLSVTYSADVNASINNQTNQLIDNQNQNTQDIIGHIGDGVHDIIDNQNQNTQQQIESQKVCKIIDNNNIFISDKYLNVHGELVNSSTSFGVTDYIKILDSKIIPLSTSGTTTSACFYNVNKVLISCITNPNLVLNSEMNIPNNSYYARFSINKIDNMPQFKICTNGNQATTDAISDLNDTLTDDNISDSEFENALDIDTGSDLSFGPFSGFLMLPLTWVQTILVPQDSCQVINLPLPYMNNKYLTLPCMDEFWNSLGAVGNLISLVWIAVVGVRIFNGLYVLTVETTSSEANAEELYKIRSWDL